MSWLGMPHLQQTLYGSQIVHERRAALKALYTSRCQQISKGFLFSVLIRCIGIFRCGTTIGGKMDEYEKLNIEAANRTYDTWARTRTDLFNSVIATGSYILRVLNTINAGALIALLAFMGSTAGKTDGALPYITHFAHPMKLLYIGLLLSVGATAGMYFAQLFYALSAQKRRFDLQHPYAHKTVVSKVLNIAGMLFHFITIASAALSFAAFTVSIYECISIFAQLKS
jgi:hypothetical protein